jgi:hypothetical protein
VRYSDILVGECFVDRLIDDVLRVEDHQSIGRAHMPPGAGPRGRMQCTNYLKAAGLQLCLLLDFGKPRLEINRVAHGL